MSGEDRDRLRRKVGTREPTSYGGPRVLDFREVDAPPPADPAGLVNAIRAVLDDDMLDDAGVVRAIEALLRVAP